MTPSSDTDATYSGDPSNSTIDEVRFKCGDTGGSTFDELNEFFLTNAEVQYAVDNSGTTTQAALACAKRIRNKLAREVDASAGDGSVSLSQRIEHFEIIIDDLSEDTKLESLKPFAGGISKSDKEMTEEDTDRVDPFFVREQFDSFRVDGPREHHDHDNTDHHY